MTYCAQRKAWAYNAKSATETIEYPQPFWREAGYDTAALEDIFDVLGAQGGCCDCEILYNVAESFAWITPIGTTKRLYSIWGSC